MRSLFALIILASLFTANAAAESAAPATAPIEQSTASTNSAERCEAITGSRIRPLAERGKPCNGSAPFVQSYSRDDLLGADPFDLGRALSKLNASVQVR